MIIFTITHIICTQDGVDFCEIEEQSRSWLKHPTDPFSNGFTFDDKILKDLDVIAAIESNQPNKIVKKSYHITNVDRSAFARISGAIAGKYGDIGFKSSLQFDLTGGAGQSFGAFICNGIDITLTGYANDYVAKGMAGGSIIINPPPQDERVKGSALFKESSGHSVVGNTVLYGATGGTLLVRGRGGERFAVRNSGASAVIEGLGDHGCEYMTAGNVICLGSVGRNFAAGMTGGLAFILPDENWFLEGDSKQQTKTNKDIDFKEFVNGESVSIRKLTRSNEAAMEHIKSLLSRHVKFTNSSRGQKVLANIESFIEKFWVVIPNSEKTNPILLDSKEHSSKSEGALQ